MVLNLSAALEANCRQSKIETPTGEKRSDLTKKTSIEEIMKETQRLVEMI